jgi:hypothetical protein
MIRQWRTVFLTYVNVAMPSTYSYFSFCVLRFSAFLAFSAQSSPSQFKWLIKATSLWHRFN